MKRELLLATTLSAVWISMSFLLFGGLYTSLPKLIGWGRFNRFENSLGQIDVFGDAEMAWVSLLVFGAVMFVTCVPINYYWLRRLEDA